MSAFVVSNISPSLKVDNSQRFVFGLVGLPEPLGSFSLDNIFVPVISTPSTTNWEMRNNALSGFRWTHKTESTDTIGSYKLQSFIGASPTGTDILSFNNDGSLTFLSTANFSSDVDMSGHRICNSADPLDPLDLVTKQFAESLVVSGSIDLTGAVTGSGVVGVPISTTLNTTLNNVPPATANLDINNHRIINTLDPVDAQDVVTKNAMDLSLAGYLPVGGAVTSVYGTTGQVNVINGTSTPTISISTTYLGQSSITTLGTITTGAWNASIVPSTFGGTGVDNGVRTLQYNDNVLIGNSFNTSGIVNINGGFVTSGGMITLRASASTDVTLPITGTLATQSWVLSNTGNTLKPNVSLPFSSLTFDWGYAGATNPAPYELVNILTDAQQSKNFKYKVLTNDIVTKEWNHDYTLIGNSDCNGLYKINYNVLTFTFTPFSISIFPFAASQNLTTITTRLSLNNNRITDVIDPVGLQDAATKNFVLNAISGITSGTVTLTGAVTGSGNVGTPFSTSFSNSQTINGTTQTFNYSNSLTSSVFSIKNTNAGSLTVYMAGTVSDYVGLGYSGDDEYSIVDIMGPSNDRLAFRANGVGVAALLKSGLFGLGTITPTMAKLQIVGGVQNILGEESCFRAISSSTSTKIELQNTTAITGKLYEIRSTGTGDFDVTDRTGSATRFVISPTGNVGLNMGTSIPNSALQFSNPDKQRLITFYESANNSFQYTGFGQVGGSLYTYLCSTLVSNTWYAATSSTTSTEVAKIKGDGCAHFKKIVGYSSTTPIIVINPSGAGTGATVSISGSEVGGIIILTTGNGAGNGNILVVNLVNAMPNTNCAIMLTPGNTLATQVTDRIWSLQANATQFSINSRTNLANNSSYIWNYAIIGGY
jgi:hypothetical protein